MSKVRAMMGKKLLPCLVQNATLGRQPTSDGLNLEAMVLSSERFQGTGENALHSSPAPSPAWDQKVLAAWRKTGVVNSNPFYRGVSVSSIVSGRQSRRAVKSTTSTFLKDERKMQIEGNKDATRNKGHRY